MKSKLKSLSVYIYFFISIFFMEVFFRLFTIKKLPDFNIVFPFLFSLSLSLILTWVCTRLKEKINYGLALGISSFMGIIFSSQLIYFKFFRTFYTVYSASNPGQVMEFWKDILATILRSIPMLLVFFIPLAAVIYLKDKYIFFHKIEIKWSPLFIVFVFIFHFSGVGMLYVWGMHINSPYDLYYNSSNPVLSIDQLGLMESLTIDVKRSLFGWHPSLESTETSNIDMPPVIIDNIPQSTDNIDTSNTVGSTTSTPIIVEKKPIEYNKMSIDFDALIQNESDDKIIKMHKYFSNIPPTEKNDYTGMFEGYNLIFLTAESFSPYALDEKLTPTLNMMINDGFKFTNFYNPIWGVSTSDGEYVACTSLIPKSGVWSMYHSGDNFLPFVMGNQFRNLGCETFAYHNHDYKFYRRDVSHPNLGYDYKGLGKGLKVKATWPESDLEMMEKTLPEYIGSERFHAYYMTVSGHMQYSFDGNSMSLKNRKYVDSLDLSEEGKAYIAANLELEKAMTYLLAQLEEAGIADKTLIVLSADHYPYGLKDETFTELAGHPIEQNFELFRSPLIIYAKGMTPKVIDKQCSSLDIIPTISNLLGLEYDSRLLMGRDILSNSEPLVVFLNKSFITDKGMYNAVTRKFEPFGDFQVTDKYINYYQNVVQNKFYYSMRILDSDYYRIILEKE